MDEKRAWLKEQIEKKVFITYAEERIVSARAVEQPWIFDFRKILMEPKVLHTLQDLFCEAFPGDQPIQIGGVEAAAIPLITALTLGCTERKRDAHGFFIRKSRKKTDLLRMIEGGLTDNDIILVDDILNSGSSLARQVTILESLGKKVTALFVILQYRDTSFYKFFEERGIHIVSLFTLDDFSHTLSLKNIVHEERTPTPRPFVLHWCFKAPQPNYFYVIPKSTPALDSRALYFGSDNGTFWSIDQTDGSVLWKYTVGIHARGKYIFSSPALYGDLVYFGAYDGNFYALNKHTGKRVWTNMDADWVGSSPVLSPRLNMVYIGLEYSTYQKRGGIVALDAHTGEKKWSYTLTDFVHATPAYSDKNTVVVIGGNDGLVHGFNAQTGELLWKFATGAEVRASCVFSEDEKLVAFGSHDSYLYILNTTTGALVHKIQTKEAIYSTPCVYKNLVYMPSLDKILYAVDLSTGVIVWTFQTEGRIFSSPTIIRDRLYVGSNDARLYELDPLSGKQTGVLQVTERITNSLVYNPDTRRFFLPTFANEIYCFSRQEPPVTP